MYCCLGCWYVAAWMHSSTDVQLPACDATQGGLVKIIAGKHQCFWPPLMIGSHFSTLRTDVYMAASCLAVEASRCLTKCMHGQCSHAVDVNSWQDDTKRDASKCNKSSVCMSGVIHSFVTTLCVRCRLRATALSYKQQWM